MQEVETAATVAAKDRWPKFQVSKADPVLGDLYAGKVGMTPEQTLVEFVSTSAAFHQVKKQPLHSLEWELLQVFTNNVMPANAAAWYMAKRKYYMDHSFDQQLLPILLKKFPEKFRILGSQVIFLEVYERETARQKLQYLVQYGLYAYFSHKAEEYGVYFFDPRYYENTEPFHESLRLVCPRSGQGKLVKRYFSQESLQQVFTFRQHTSFLVSISKLSSNVKVVTNTTGVIVSMINSQYGFIKFGAAEKALFCIKSLYKDGWQFSGDPLKLPAMKFDGYQIQGSATASDTWYAVLVWCGQRPSPQHCSTVEDLNSTPVFRENRNASKGSLGEIAPKRRQPSSSMMVGQVVEVRKEGAVIRLRDSEDSPDRVWVPGWRRKLANSPGVWLNTLDGDFIGKGDLVAYYVSQEVKEGFTAVGRSATVLKECQEKGKNGRRKRISECSVATTSELSESKEGSDSESDFSVSEGELEWLEKDLGSIISAEDPSSKTMDLLKMVQNNLKEIRKKPGRRVTSGESKLFRPGYTPLPEKKESFWRMKQLLANVDSEDYHSDSDPDYNVGDSIKEAERSFGEVPSDSNDYSHSTYPGSEDSGRRRGRRRTITGSSSVTDFQDVEESKGKKKLPFWVTACSQPEAFDPVLEKFVPVDRHYREDRDPDYKLPNTDFETDTEDEEENYEEEVELLLKEAEEEIEDVKKKMTSPPISPVKVTLTPAKDEESEETNEADEIVTLVSGDEDKVIQKPLSHPLWVREMEMTEQNEEYDSDEDEEYVPPPVCLDSSFEYDEYLSGDDVISDEEVKDLLEESKVPVKPPSAYLAVWVEVGSMKEIITRAKEEILAVKGEAVNQVALDMEFVKEPSIDEGNCASQKIPEVEKSSSDVNSSEKVSTDKLSVLEASLYSDEEIGKK